MNVPRVAFFADSFHEVNGVARTSREFARFALRQQYPFFSVHTGATTSHVVDATFETYEIGNSGGVVRLEADLFFDLFFLRHYARLAKALSRFRPDLIHITGPSHCGLLGAMLAWRFNIPLVMSWHTNLHEYAARRCRALLKWLPGSAREHSVRLVQTVSLWVLIQFYRRARLLFAPNPELIDLLATKTRRPTYSMHRGIDIALFSPECRRGVGSEFVIGYVGRLSPEKNVRALAEVERELIARGLGNYRFSIVGSGQEKAWLAANMKACELPGVLLGAELAHAYAAMNVFVFPSATDTFGNVVLEAMASGVPVIVTAEGGPKYQVDPGVTGFVARDLAECASYLLQLHDNPALRREMGRNARRRVLSLSWESVFDGVFQIYGEAIASGILGRRSRLSSRAPVAQRC